MRIPNNLKAKFIKEAIKNGMKVLTLDAETSHMIVRTFYIGQKVSIQHTQVKVPTKVITIQYKWMHEKKPKYLEWDKVSNKYDDARNFDDSSMIEEFVTGVLAKADIIIGQNSDGFDIKVLNERAKELHLTPLDQKPSIDILKLSRKSVKAASHKLDYRSAQQGLGGKIKMIDQDWVDIEENNRSVKKKMVPYGLKDVTDTEQLFWDELPYYKDLPTSVEKVILTFLNLPDIKGVLPQKKQATLATIEKRKLQCIKCIKKRYPSYDTKILKNKVEVRCNRCNYVWRLKK